MNTEKKERIQKKQHSRAILARNRKINKINIFILGAGLLLKLAGHDEVGNVLLWPGIAIFVYTQFTSIKARRT